MHPDEILQTTGHRPFELPEGKWLMRQIWQDLLFAHWPVDPALMASLIPEQLKLDLWQDQAWISLSPFYMRHVNIRGLPALPFTSSFLELNFRTYVTHQGKPGIFLFSADAENWLTVKLSRLFGLPYMNAAMSWKRENGRFQYICHRTDSHKGAAQFTATYYPTSSEVFHAVPDTQLYWLTERYSLYALKGRSLLVANIHHFPWPLQSAQLELEQSTITEASGIPLPDTEPIITYTKQLEVLIWPIRKV